MKRRDGRCPETAPVGAKRSPLFVAAGLDGFRHVDDESSARSRTWLALMMVSPTIRVGEADDMGQVFVGSEGAEVGAPADGSVGYEEPSCALPGRQ